MTVINDDNYAVGGIDLYFCATVGHASLERGTPIGTSFRIAGRNLGNIVTSEIAVDVTYLEHFISVNGKRRRDKVVSNVESISIPFTFDEINTVNLKKALLASSLAGTGRVAPMQKPVQRGSVSLKFRSPVGNDVYYNIPKATIRPDGNLSIGDGTDWWTQSMVIDIEYCSTTDQWASKPYGLVQIV